MSDDTALVRAYLVVGVPVDRLPYTPEVARLVELARSNGWKSGGEREAFWRLITLRKNRQLPARNRAAE